MPGEGPAQRRRAGPRVAVIGAGIAGLSVADALLGGGARSVSLFEAETTPGKHSSGRNAAIWLPTEEDDDAPELTRRSVAILDELLGPTGWKKQCGAFKVARSEAALASHAEAAKRSGCSVQYVDAAEMRARIPLIEVGPADRGIYIPQAGIMDIHAMQSALYKRAKSRGLQSHFATHIDRLEIAGQSLGQPEWTLVSGVRSYAGFDWVVDASGAFAGRLLAPWVERPAVRPMRRHLILLRPPRAEIPRPDCIVWSVEDELYLRPEADGLLTSPCDAELSEAGMPATQPECGEWLQPKLQSWFPKLCDWGISQSWAGLRSFGPDGRSLIGLAGAPPGLGLAWVAGLGGRGMTIGVGAGDRCARELLAVHAQRGQGR